MPGVQHKGETLTQGYGSGNTGKTVERLAETATPQKRHQRRPIQASPGWHERPAGASPGDVPESGRRFEVYRRRAALSEVS